MGTPIVETKHIQSQNWSVKTSEFHNRGQEPFHQFDVLKTKALVFYEGSVDIKST